jgi:peptide/nickel transport system substrate-binding protein
LVPVDRPGPDRERLAEAVRISLALSGLTVQVRAEAGEAYLRALRQGEGDLAVHETVLDINDPHFAIAPLLASSAAVRGIATNVAFYRSASVDSMLTRAGQLSFRAERLRLYQRLQALAADELPYVPLFVRLQWAVARPGVRGLRLDPGGLHRLDRAWVETTPAAGGAPPSR